MRISTRQHLSAIPTSFRWMIRHRGLVAGISLLWAALKTLAPFVQLKAGIPDTYITTSLVDMAFTLPVLLYLLPMFTTYVDAEFNHHPANPLQGWRVSFEARWLKAACAQVLLHLLAGIGLAAMILPGLVVYFMLGWMPIYTLLRGGSIAHAARWSARIMVQKWRRVILAVLPIFAIYFALICCLVLYIGYAMQHWGHAPTLWLRFRHPHFWFTSFVSAAINIWLSLALLALFHQVENEAMLKLEDPDQRRK